MSAAPRPLKEPPRSSSDRPALPPELLEPPGLPSQTSLPDCPPGLPSQVQLKEVFDKADADGDNAVNFAEFEALMKKAQLFQVASHVAGGASS